MAVVLPPQSGNIYSEYTATNTTFSRLLQTIAGIITPVFECRINYERKDYLVNENGERIATVTPPDSNMPPAGPPSSNDNTRYGSVYVPYDQMAPIWAVPGDPSKMLAEQVADMIDGLIQKDLVARGIIPAPVNP